MDPRSFTLCAVTREECQKQLLTSRNSYNTKHHNMHRVWQLKKVMNTKLQCMREMCNDEKKIQRTPSVTIHRMRKTIEKSYEHEVAVDAKDC